MLCFITVSPGNERSRETMESDHRSSARHKLCAPPAPSLPGSPSFPAVCAVWDWGRSIHQAEGGLLDPCISVLGSPRPLGRVSRCWVPPKWGRSSHRREDVVQGREGLGHLKYKCMYLSWSGSKIMNETGQSAQNHAVRLWVYYFQK